MLLDLSTFKIPWLIMTSEEKFFQYHEKYFFLTGIYQLSCTIGVRKLASTHIRASVDAHVGMTQVKSHVIHIENTS